MFGNKHRVMNAVLCNELSVVKLIMAQKSNTKYKSVLQIPSHRLKLNSDVANVRRKCVYLRERTGSAF